MNEIIKKLKLEIDIADYGGEDKIRISVKLLKDVLKLLKEQEAKQVIGIVYSIEGMEKGYCPSCDRAIVNKKLDETTICKFCGQVVKWR